MNSVEIKYTYKDETFWCIELNSKEDLSKYISDVLKAEYEKGFENGYNSRDFHQITQGHLGKLISEHCSHQIACGWLSKLNVEIKGGKIEKVSPVIILEHFLECYQSHIDALSKLIDKGISIYIHKNLISWMPLPKDAIIVTRYETNEFKFPKYFETDIKIMQWQGGKHWYAKIGSIDVVDEFGNQKWSSYSTAKEVAQKYLNDLK